MSAADQEQLIANLKRDAARFEAAQKALEAAREDLAASIVDALKDRVLTPTEVADLVPYDRVHVGRIARAGGVEPLREPTVASRKKTTRRRPKREPAGDAASDS